MKKFLSLLLAVVMVFSTVSFAAPMAVDFADSADEVSVSDAATFVPEPETAEIFAEDTWYDTTKGTLLFNMDFESDNDGNAVAATAYDGLSLSSYSAGAGELVSGLGRLNPDVTDHSSYDMGFRYTTAANTTIAEENGNKYLSLSSSGSNQISLYLGNTYTKTGTYVFEYSYKLVSTGATTPNHITYNTLIPTEGGNDTYIFNEWVTETATFEVSSIPSYSRVMFYGAGNYSTSDVLYLDDIKVWYYDETLADQYDDLANSDIETNDVWEDADKGTLLMVADFDVNNNKKKVTEDALDTMIGYLADVGNPVTDLGRVNPDLDTAVTSLYNMSFRYASAVSLGEEDGNQFVVVNTSGSYYMSPYVGNVFTEAGTYTVDFKYKYVPSAESTATFTYIERKTPSGDAILADASGEWATASFTYDVTAASDIRYSFTSSGSSDLFLTSDAFYIDDIKIYKANEEEVAVPEIDWTDDEKGDLLFTLDFDVDNDNNAVATTALDTLTNYSNNIPLTTLGHVNPDYYAANVWSIFGHTVSDSTVASDTDGNQYLSTLAATSGASIYIESTDDAGRDQTTTPFITNDAGYYTLDFDYKVNSSSINLDIRYNTASSSYTGTVGEWASYSYLSTTAYALGSIRMRMNGTATGNTIEMDNIKLYYKPQTVSVTLSANGNADFSDVVVSNVSTLGTTASELLANVNNTTGKELLGVARTADGEVIAETDTIILAADTTLYLVWGEESTEPETPVINDVWEDETKGKKLFTIDFEAKNDGTVLDSSSWDSILNRLDNYPETGELVSDIGRINPDVDGSDYRISINYIDNTLTALVKDGDNTTFELAPASGKGDLSLYLGGFYEGEGTYTFETSYKFVQTGTNAVGQIRYETIGAVYTDSSYFSTGDWVNLSEVHEHASSDTHADVNRLRITTPDFSNTPYATTDRIYLDNITVYYKAPAVEEPEETTEVWYDRTKGTLLFNMDFESDNDGNAVAATAYDGLSLSSYSAGAGELVSGLGRLNPDVTDHSSYDMGFRYSSSPALVTEDGNTYLSLNSSGTASQLSLYLGNTYTKTGTYVFEYTYKFVSTGTTTANNITYNTLIPSEGGTDTFTFDAWVTETATFEVSTIPSYSRVMFYGVSNYSTSDKLYLDDIKVWYYDESVDYDEILGEEDKGEWNPDETLGTKLFVIDLDGDTNYTTADLSKLAYRIDGTSDNSDSNGLYAEAIGRVNPDYATTYANTFKYSFKDGGTPTVTGDTDKYFTHTATTNPSVMVANPFVGAGTYTLLFNHEAAKTFNVHSGYTGGTATTTVIDDTWAQTAYTIDISEQGANDYFRIIGTAGATTYLIDDVALYYKNTAATVTVYANGNANVSDTVVTVNSDTGMTAAELVAKVDTSASAKELLGASLTADGELLAADYVVMPGTVSGIYLIWGDDIEVDEEPWWEDGLGTLLFDINWDGELATTEQTRWADVRAAGASTNPDWKNFEKMYFMWGTEDIGGGSTWVPATSPLIVAEANGNRYYRQPHNSTYNSWSLYSTFDGDWAGWADGDGVFTITYKVKTVGNITANNLFLDTTLVYNHATTRQDIRHFYSTLPDSNGWLTVTVQFDTSEYTTNVGETLGQLLFYVQTNESTAVADAYICYDDIEVYYKPSKVNVTMKPGTCLEVTETVVEASTAGVLASDLIALVDTQDTTLLPTGLTNEDGSVKYALTDTVVLDADTTLVITWESNEWMDNELGMLIQKADFEGEIQTTTINRWPAATALGATINPDYDFEGVTGLQFTVANTGIAYDSSMMWIPSDYDVTENGNTYFEVPTGNKAYGTSTQYSQISIYAMGSGASQYAYEGAGTYTITGKVKYGSDIQNAYFEVRPNAYNGSGLTGGFNYQFTEVVAGEWNEFSVTWSTEESAAYGLGSVEFYLFYDALSEASTIAYDDIMLYYKPFTAEITLRANNNPIAKDIVLSDVSTSGITTEELLSNIRTPLGGMDLVGLAYDKAGTNMLEGTVVVGGDARFFMIWKESELDPNAPVSENVNSIRTDDPIGMRYRAYLTTTVAENAEQIGWVITRYDMLEELSINPYDFYLDTEVTKVTAYNKDTDGTNKIYGADDTNTYVTAVLYNIPEEHYETTLVARPFTVVDGVTYYGYPIERSICEVAEAIRDGGYASCTNDQMFYIQAILTACDKEI